MKKIIFTTCLALAFFTTKAQIRTNASDWHIPIPGPGAEPTAPPVTLPNIVFPPADGWDGSIAIPPAPPMPPYPLPEPPDVVSPSRPPDAPTGKPTGEGYFNSNPLGGDGPYFWHPGILGDPSAPGPGYYDTYQGGWQGWYDQNSVGPLYWHPPITTPPTGGPTGPGHWAPGKPTDGKYFVYFLHPGIPGNPYTFGPGYYDSNSGGWIGDFTDTTSPPLYWVPDPPNKPSTGTSGDFGKTVPGASQPAVPDVPKAIPSPQPKPADPQLKPVPLPMPKPADPQPRPVPLPNPVGQVFNYTPAVVVSTSILLF